MKTKKLVLFILSTVYFFNYSIAQNKTSKTTKIHQGSGSFLISGGIGHENDSIQIFYHKPKNMNSKTRILMVIPGSGRNGDSYRDAWVKTSEKHNVLIISPSYPEKTYPYESYHLGGAVKNLDLTKGISFKKNTNQVYLDENIVKFHFNKNKNEWIFNDFDRIFKLVKKMTNSTQKKYDMFGHSAGGQILHRFVLMNPKSKADRILASNSGNYTLANNTLKYPFGTSNIDDIQLKKSFKKKLIVFLGELDNEHESGGKILRSTTTDKQGTNRLERGNYFYKESMEVAKNSGVTFDWELKIISNIGHNQRKMAKAAAKYLYN